MGLDVYLTKCPNRAAASALEKEASEFSEAAWESAPGSYNDLTDEQKKAIKESIAAKNRELGLDEWGESPAKETIEINSTTDPEHMFKIGYFRSSYNSGGINAVLRRAGIPTLNYIFSVGDEYEVVPDWTDALIKVNEVLDQYRKHFATPYDVIRCSGFSQPVTSEQDALAVFRKELEDYTARKATGNSFTSFSSYSSGRGDFYLEGVKVFGIIRGKDHGECTYLIVDAERPPTAEEDWYFKSLLIVRETIEYVLSQPADEQGNYYLRWSA